MLSQKLETPQHLGQFQQGFPAIFGLAMSARANYDALSRAWG